MVNPERERERLMRYLLLRMYWGQQNAMKAHITESIRGSLTSGIVIIMVHSIIRNYYALHFETSRDGGEIWRLQKYELNWNYVTQFDGLIEFKRIITFEFSAFGVFQRGLLITTPGWPLGPWRNTLHTRKYFANFPGKHQMKISLFLNCKM